MCVSHFPQFSFFSPYSRSYSVHFLFSPFLSVSRQFSLNRVCVSFSTFFSFLAIFQVLECVLLNLHVFQCFSNFPGHTFFVSHFPRYSVFSPHSRSYSVCVSFCNLLRFLAIIQVLHCVFLVSKFLTVSRHISGPTMCVSHFPQFSFFSPYSRSYSVHFLFSPFLSVSRQFSLNSVCVSFPRFSIFSPYSRS